MGAISRRSSLVAALVALAVLFAIFAARLNFSDTELPAGSDQHVLDPARAVQHVSPLPGQYTPARSSDSNHELSSTPRGALIITKDRIDVDVDGHSLLDLLNQISRSSGITVVADIPDRPISVRTGDVAIDAGIRQLVRGSDSFYFYDGTSGTLKSVWIYEHGRGLDAAPIPAGSWMTDVDVRRRLADVDPEVRARATEILIDRAGSRAMDWIVSALRDTNEVVRYRTLQKTVEASVALPMDVLRDILRHDSSPLARFIALNALDIKVTADPHFVTEAMGMVLDDPDESVTSHARKLLLKWEQAAKP